MAVQNQLSKRDGAVDEPGRVREPVRERPSAAKALFLLILVAYAYFIPRGSLANADSHLALTYSIVELGTLRIDHFALNPDLIDKSAYCGSTTSSCTHYYTDKAPGISLLVAVVYLPLHYVLPQSMMPASPTGDRFLLRYLLTLLAISVPCSLFAAIFWRFMTRFVDSGWAMTLALGYACGTIAMPFAMLLFSHALTAAFMFSAFILLFVATRPGATEPRADRLSGLAGILAGLAVSGEYPAAIIAALLGIYAAVASLQARGTLWTATAYAVGGIIGFCPALFYNLAVYGSPFAFGYAHLTDPYYAAGMSRGVLGVSTPSLEALWGTTFSPFRGLFVLSPWLLLAGPGLLEMRRRGMRLEAFLCAGVALAYFVFQISYAFWNGGASVGPRHFLPALPFLVFPIAFVERTGALRRIGAVLIGYSIVVLVAVVATNPLFGDPHYVRGAYNPLIDQTWHDVVTGHWQNTWAMLFGLRGPLALAPLAVFAVLQGRLIRRGIMGPIGQE